MNLSKSLIPWECSATVDASDLGLPPGEWPSSITIAAPTGGGVLQVRRSTSLLSAGDRELQEVTYTGCFGETLVTLVVRND